MAAIAAGGLAARDGSDPREIPVPPIATRLGTLPGAFNQHWFLALAAPRPFIALEGDSDRIFLPEAVRQSMARRARPAYALFGAEDRLGVDLRPPR